MIVAIPINEASKAVFDRRLWIIPRYRFSGIDIGAGLVDIAGLHIDVFFLCLAAAESLDRANKVT